jgi:hypothetical protein
MYGRRKHSCLFRIDVRDGSENFNDPRIDRKTFKKKRKLDELGLGGIISCIAFNPSLPTVFALATYSRHLGVYLDPLNLVSML